MKKVLLLCLLMLSLTACGGGGGSAVDTAREVPVGAATGTLNVIVKDGSATAKAMAALSDKTKVRVSVTNPTLKVNGVMLKDIQDAELPGASLSFTLPVASGYVVEIVTYKEAVLSDGVTVDTTQPKTLQKYGMASALTTSEGSTSVAITLSDVPVPTVNFPATPSTATDITTGTVYSGIMNGNYYGISIAAKTDSTGAVVPSPLRTGWAVTESLNDLSTPLHLISGVATQHTTIKAPVVFHRTPYNAVAEFYLKDSLLKSGENYIDWRINSAVLHTDLLVKEGNMVFVIN